MVDHVKLLFNLIRLNKSSMLHNILFLISKGILEAIGKKIYRDGA